MIGHGTGFVASFQFQCSDHHRHGRYVLQVGCVWFEGKHDNAYVGLHGIVFVASFHIHSALGSGGV